MRAVAFVVALMALPSVALASDFNLKVTNPDGSFKLYDLAAAPKFELGKTYKCEAQYQVGKNSFQTASIMCRFNLPGRSPGSILMAGCGDFSGMAAINQGVPKLMRDMQVYDEALFNVNGDMWRLEATCKQ